MMMLSSRRRFGQRRFSDTHSQQLILLFCDEQSLAAAAMGNGAQVSVISPASIGECSMEQMCLLEIVEVVA